MNEKRFIVVVFGEKQSAYTVNIHHQSVLHLKLNVNKSVVSYCSLPCEEEPSALSVGCRPCDTHQGEGGRKEDLRENEEDRFLK